MRPRVVDILLNLEFSEPEPIPIGPVEAMTEGKVYALEIPEGDPLLALLAPPCPECGRACDGSCWDDFAGIEGDD